MTTILERSRRVIDLNRQIEVEENFLKKLQRLRESSVSMDFTFYAKNSSGYPEKELERRLKFDPGDLPETAATILARMSDVTAHNLRRLRSELRELEILMGG